MCDRRPWVKIEANWQSEVYNYKRILLKSLPPQFKLEQELLNIQLLLQYNCRLLCYIYLLFKKLISLYSLGLKTIKPLNNVFKVRQNLQRR